MKTLAITAALTLLALTGTVQATQVSPVQINAAKRTAGSLPGSVAPGAQGRPWTGTASDVPLEPADKARLAATRKTFVVTAMYEGVPFRVMDVVIDSEGLAYSTSQQSFKDPNGDELRIHVTGYAPVAADVTVVKANKHEGAMRERVAFGDLPQGGDALALRAGHLSVLVERRNDEVDLRSESILGDQAVHLHKAG